MFKKPMFFYDASSAGGLSPAEPGSSTDYKALYEALKRDLDSGGKWIAMERYTGLQNVLQQSQDKVTALTSELGGFNGKLGDLTVAKTTLETELAQAKTSLTELSTFKQTAEQKLQGLETKTKRYEVLVEKFPDLVAFEGKKLLPDAPIDQLEKVFSDFRTTLADITKTASKQMLNGASPDGTTQSGVINQVPVEKSEQIKALGDQKMDAARLGDVKLYDKLDAQQKALTKS